MKRILFTRGVAAVILAAVFLTSCGAPAREGDAEPREVRATLIVESTEDLSYNDGIIMGLRTAEDRYRGTDTEFIVNVFSMQTSNGSEKEEMELAMQVDSELIFIAYQNILPVLEPAAAYHPDKKLVLLDMEATGVNVFCALFNSNEAAYLCGYLAAKVSETGIVGIVIGMDIPALHDFAVGYIQGALAADPECKVIVSTVGNFYDAEIGYQLTVEQFENGVDVVFNAAGGAGMGCIRAAKDFGRLAIGVDIDQAEFVDEELRDVIITSCLKKFDSLIGVIVENYLSGSLNFGQSVRFGVRDGAVGIARGSNYFSMVPTGVQNEIDAQEEKIRNSDINVKSAFTMTHREIEELIDSAKP